MPELNETHDPVLRSWVESAHAPASDFPIQNLPFAIFRRRGANQPFRGGVAIGAEIIDLAVAHKAGIFSGDAQAGLAGCTGPLLNPLMAMGPSVWSALRLALSRALRPGAKQSGKLRACLVAQREAEFSLPAQIGDYTDFYTSMYHAMSVGRLFRPDNPLLPNYKWMPIGYHGRTSTIEVSGQRFARPLGQTMPAGAQAPLFGASARLDYELEMAIYIGPGNTIG
ncbi:MAG TPA: hypothetical protein VN878_00245, partial [Usitatibacter sp.]|nr:hypothetical protein [Usitatibacter sp.]